jgi:hypothetical protein
MFEHKFRPHGATSGNGYQFAVLIDHVQMVDDGEQVVVGLLDCVGLLRADELSRPFAYAPYHSVLDGKIELFLGGRRGELQPVVRLFPLMNNERPNQMVETGAEVVDDLADEYGYGCREADIAADAERVARAIRLKLFRDAVVLSLCREEIGDLLFDQLDLFVGSAQFGADVMERSRELNLWQ